MLWSQFHQTLPAEDSDLGQVKELVLRLVEEDLVLEIKLQMLAIGILLQELAQELLVEKEVNLLLGQHDIEVVNFRQILIFPKFHQLALRNLLVNLGTSFLVV